MVEFLQANGQTILFVVFVGILVSLALFIVFAHPKTTCCASRRRYRFKGDQVS
jgi:hypothetical protein